MWDLVLQLTMLRVIFLQTFLWVGVVMCMPKINLYGMHHVPTTVEHFHVKLDVVHERIDFDLYNAYGSM